MFDAHILYYAYNNTEGDEFGVGYLGNKEFWVHLINGWNRNDNNKHRVKVEDWDELEPLSDLRGCELAEVEPDDDGYLITWIANPQSPAPNMVEEQIRVNSDWSMEWVHGLKSVETGKAPSIPRWANRLKNQLREL